MAGQVKLMCSYGGEIRYDQPHNKISYVDGHTKILYVYRCIGHYDILSELRSLSHPYTVKVTQFKYLFPGKDHNRLITVDSQEDLENMMREYDKLSNDSNTNPVMELFISKY